MFYSLKEGQWVYTVMLASKVSQWTLDADIFGLTVQLSFNAKNSWNVNKTGIAVGRSIHTSSMVYI